MGRVSRETGRVGGFFGGIAVALKVTPDQRGVSRETEVRAATPLRELNEQILQVAR